MKDEKIGDWIKLDNEKLQVLSSSSNIRVMKSRTVKQKKACGMYGTEEKVIVGFGGKTKG
jgi:hypothetical protein